MGVCTSCKAQTNKLYWQRPYPDSFLCRNCWLEPSQDVDDLARRNAIAAVLREIRLTDKAMARKAYLSLRGRGVPPRKRKKRG